MRWCVLLLLSSGAVWAAEQGPMPRLFADFDLSDYKTVDQLQKATIVVPKRSDVTPYLGVVFKPQGTGLQVEQIDTQSPAAKLLKVNDIVTAINGQPQTMATIRDFLHSKAPGDKLTLKMVRDNKPQEVTITLAKATMPFTGTESEARPSLGVLTEAHPKGMRIRDYFGNNSAARDAGLKIGDIITQANGRSTLEIEQITEAFSNKRPGDTVKIVILRDDKETTIDLKLGASATGKRGFGGGGGQPDPQSWDNRQRRTFQKPVFRLAVIPMSFTDVAPSTKITPKDWENALFSKGTYTTRSVTGSTVYGSMHDYYFEQSCGKLSVEGKCFTSVKLNRKRSEYAETQRQTLFNDTLNGLLARDGAEALKGYDGVFFLYAGSTPQGTQRGGLYWPHQSTIQFKGESWRYFISPEGADNMASISTSCHEFGHMLGLPDLYAKPEVPGMEGVGEWCAMSNQVRNGRPQHFGAWSKEQMKWVTPTIVDPSVPQKVILSPIEGTTDQLVKVLVRADGSEYFLLEVRKKVGFDKSVPAEGLLIWRVVDGRPILEESHGIAGPSGPRRYPENVPFPSRANSSFTPYTVPSSESIKGNAKPVFITNIRKLPDGRVAFQIGYEFY